MAGNRKSESADASALRLSFPADEERLPWLPLLLDSCALADSALARAVKDEESRRKQRLACENGCGNCCEHQSDVPLFPHELVGIYWYVLEKTSAQVKVQLRERLAGHTPEGACPFVIDSACSIHPLRPLGCRQFNVFNEPCAAGEDPYFTRREDVLDPPTGLADRALIAVIPFYEVDANDTEAAISFIRRQMINLRTFDWRKLAAMIPKSDKPD